MKIKYLKSAQKDVKKIKDKKVQKNIVEAVMILKEASSLKKLTNVKKLSGHPFAYRMRIGNYRLGFYMESDTIEIARFAKQNDIYKLFP